MADETALRGQPSPRVLALIATLMALVSTVATALILGSLVPARGQLAAAVAVAVLVAVRWLARNRSASTRSRRIAAVVHVLLCLGLVAISPFYAFYAWICFLDLGMAFCGLALVPAMLLAAAPVALAQSGGGLYVGHFITLAFPLLVLANAGLAYLMTRITQSREAEHARTEQALRDLERAHRENAFLQGQLLSQARDAGVLEERDRLSQDLHDSVAQGLLAVITQLAACEDETDDPRRQARIRRADEAARESLAETRRVVRALASPHLDDTDLPSAIVRFADPWGVASGVATNVLVVGAPRPTQADADLFRVCQEALSNIARHAGAKRADLTVTYLDGEVRLDVRDDGRGFDPATPVRGHGLTGMRARIGRAGGLVEIESGLGHGSTVSIAVPA